MITTLLLRLALGIEASKLKTNLGVLGHRGKSLAWASNYSEKLKPKMRQRRKRKKYYV